MLMLLLSKAQDRKNVWELSKPSHVGIHMKALSVEYQFCQGFGQFPSFFALFHFEQLSHISSRRVKLTV